MQKIINSASKIVFIMLALSACVGFFLRILEAKDFMVLAGMAFGFYFSFKGEKGEEYAGK
jgi:uncharacterized membrane protein